MRRYKIGVVEQFRKDKQAWVTVWREDQGRHGVLLDIKTRDQATGLAWWVFLLMRVFMRKALAATVQVFPTKTGGDFYVRDASVPVSDVLLAHEAVHIIQARTEASFWRWRLKYLFLPSKRLEYEAEAYWMQVQTGVLTWDDVAALLVKFYMLGTTRVENFRKEHGLH